MTRNEVRVKAAELYSVLDVANLGREDCIDKLTNALINVGKELAQEEIARRQKAEHFLMEKIAELKVLKGENASTETGVSVDVQEAPTPVEAAVPEGYFRQLTPAEAPEKMTYHKPGLSSLSPQEALQKLKSGELTSEQVQAGWKGKK